MEQDVGPRGRPDHCARGTPPGQRRTFRGKDSDQNVEDRGDGNRGIKKCKDQDAQRSERHQHIDEMTEQLPSLPQGDFRRFRILCHDPILSHHRSSKPALHGIL